MINKIDAMRDMFNLQNNLNVVVNENWQELNREWYRAAWIECGELMEHIGWKWWKKQTPNREQAFMEMVDIFHFAISDNIQRKGLKEETVLDAVKKLESACLINPIKSEIDPESLLKSLERYTATIIMSEKVDMFDFFTLMNQFGFTFEELYYSYVGKNVLNTFRQDNGYKTGEYEKIWMGKEDNVHLQETLDKLKQVDAVINLPNILYELLDKIYQEVLISKVAA